MFTNTHITNLYVFVLDLGTKFSRCKLGEIQNSMTGYHVCMACSANDVSYQSTTVHCISTVGHDHSAIVPPLSHCATTQRLRHHSATAPPFSYCATIQLLRHHLALRHHVACVPPCGLCATTPPLCVTTRLSGSVPWGLMKRRQIVIKLAPRRDCSEQSPTFIIIDTSLQRR